MIRNMYLSLFNIVYNVGFLKLLFVFQTVLIFFPLFFTWHFSFYFLATNNCHVCHYYHHYNHYYCHYQLFYTIIVIGIFHTVAIFFIAIIIIVPVNSTFPCIFSSKLTIFDFQGFIFVELPDSSCFGFKNKCKIASFSQIGSVYDFIPT